MTEQEWRKNFAREIKKRLRAQYIDQKELSKRSGIAENTLSRYITFQRTPRAIDVVKIAGAFGCTTDELINFGDLVE